MPDLLAGSTVTALDTPPVVTDIADDSYTFTTATFGIAATGGTYADCAVTFTAPTSGRVLICYGARLVHSTTSGSLVSAETRTGATIGTGTVVSAASDRCLSHYGATMARAGVSQVLDGLTPGNTYNTRLLHRMTGATGNGTAALRDLSVSPLS